MTQAAPVVTREPQPLGAKGPRFSLRRVAEFIRDSYTHEQVIAQARRILRDAGNPKDIEGKMRAIFAWKREKRIAWCSDPVRAEFMAHARHFLESSPGADDALLVMGDCDEQVILTVSILLAMLLAIADGMKHEQAAVLGHSYRQDKILGHVLFALHLGNGWLRGDPSNDTEPLGWYRKDFTHEVMIGVPSCVQFCDAPVCASGPGAARPPPLPNKGDFVGLAGADMDESLEFLSIADASAVDNDAAAQFEAIFLNNAADCDARVARLDADHADMMTTFAALSIDPASNDFGWDATDEAAYQTLRDAGTFLAGVFRDAADGTRKIAVFAESNDFAISALPGDAMAIAKAADGALEVAASLTLNVVDGAIASQTLGAVVADDIALIVAGIVVVAVIAGGYFAWQKLSGDQASKARAANQQAYAALTADCLANKIPPETCAKLIKATGDAAAAGEAANARGKVADTISTGIVVGGVLIVGASVAGVWYYLKMRKRKAAA